ncbi:MAG: hypothetical protein IPH97_12805 [Ignavibacteriales bacterium]|nr:hypothetical protein [Ignavibacteriales bacterium]
MKRFIFYLLLVFLTFLTINCSEKTEDEKDDENLASAIDKAKLTEFTGFYFVGNHSGIPSVFWYDYQKDKVKIFWHSPEERVIDLLISPDNKSGYFLIQKKQLLKSSQPAIEKGRLYRIDFELKRVEPISQLEEGIQVIPFWTDNDRFTLVVNSIDKTIASYINKNTQVYNRFGKLLSDNTEIFDITKDGYPITKQAPLQFNSPNELFTVVEKNDSIQIRQTRSKKEIKTRLKEKELLQISWAEDNKHVLLLMKAKTKNKTEKINQNKLLLAIFDLQKKKTVKMFDDIGASNFRLIGNYLLLDNGIGRNSTIEILKLDSLDKTKKIKINGGSSLRKI